MSKELEALEDLISFIYSGFVADTHELCKYVTERKDIIETALKEYEKIDYHNLKVRDLDKKLKVLEIIKEKQVDISCLLFDGLEIYNENMHPSRKLTQEDYDLLKEVLL